MWTFRDPTPSPLWTLCGLFGNPHPPPYWSTWFMNGPSGWGSIVGCVLFCKIPNILQGTELFLLSRSMCKEHMDEAFPGAGDAITDAMICANDHSRTCKGDSGGRCYSFQVYMLLHSSVA